MARKKTAVIVGAGYAGLASAYYLTKLDYKVVVLEASRFAGGLATGNIAKGDWPLEKFYHHLFSNDSEFINLAHETSTKIDFCK